MAQGGSLKFVVEVAADQATGALNAISTAVNQSGIKMRTSILATGDASKQAGREHGGLEQSIKSLKSEMVSGDRTINYFARSLNGLIPEASAAGQGLRLLADGLIGGFGIGLAIQGVMAGVQLFTDHLKEAEAQQKAAAEAAREYASAIDDINASAGRFGLRNATAGVQWMWSQQDAIEKQFKTNDLLREKAQLETEREALAAERSKLNPDSLLDTSRGLSIMSRLEEIKSRLTELQAPLDNAEKAMGRVRQAFQDTIIPQEQFNVQQDAMKEKAKESAKYVHDLAGALDAVGVKSAQLVGPGAQRIPDFAGADTSRDPTTLGPKDLASANEAFRKGFHPLKKEDVAKEGEDIGQAYVRPMVQTFTQGLAKMMQAQMTFRDFMKSLWSQLLDTFVQSITKLIVDTIVNKIVETVVQKTAAIAEINAYAGVAGAGAAAAMAGIPIVGPGLAVKAMTETSGAVLASMLPLASAAGGWELPSSGGPFPAILHPDEKVLPARVSKRFDALFDAMDRGGAGGGRSLTVQVSAMDASSFERWLQKGGADVIQREFRKRARAGRW